MIIDKLKKAVAENNWDLVCEAVYDLDGSTIEKTSNNPEENDFLTKLDQLKNEFLSGKTTKSFRPPVETFVPQSPKRENLFEQMKDQIKPEQEPGYDLIDDTVASSNRPKRAPYKDSEVKCETCNKTFKVHPMFFKSNYVCDRCVGRKHAK